MKTAEYTRRMILRQFNEAYWIASEMRAISSVVEWLRSKGNYVEQILDVGCGEGRLLPLFTTYSRHLYAVEPDATSIELAQKVASANKYDQVTFRNMCIEQFHTEWKGNRAFDLVICSHVLQHVNTEAVTEIVSSLGELTQKGGRIMVTTCFSNEASDEFIACEWANDGTQIERQIGEHEFNHRVSANSLAVHRFTLDMIDQVFGQAGLEIIDIGLFHLCEKNQPWKITVSDKLMLDSIALNCPPLRSCALDLFVILKGRE